MTERREGGKEVKKRTKTKTGSYEKRPDAVIFVSAFGFCVIIVDPLIEMGIIKETCTQELIIVNWFSQVEVAIQKNRGAIIKERAWYIFPRHYLSISIRIYLDPRTTLNFWGNSKEWHSLWSAPFFWKILFLDFGWTHSLWSITTYHLVTWNHKPPVGKDSEAGWVQEVPWNLS